MRDIVSPFGLRSPFGQRRDAYKVLGFRPPLVADFEQEYYRSTGRTTFDGLVTFSRASSATMVDSTGTLVTVGADEPRIGHHVWDGSAWVNEGLLHESEARTNLLTYSKDFTQWTNFQSTDAVESVSGVPDGSGSSGYFYSTSTAASVYVTVNLSVSAYTYSKFVKARGAQQWCYLQFNLSAGTLPNGKSTVWFDLVNGVEGTSSASITSSSIQSIGDGWYRISCTLPITDVSGTEVVAIGISDADNTESVTASVNNGVYVYGAQLEEGSTPSSYIPTSGSQVTRAAETLTIPAANLPWPSPRVIGEELVTNGTFDTDTTGWSANDSAILSSDSGRLKVENGAASAGDAYQVVTTEIGKAYLISATLQNGTHPARLFVGNSITDLGGLIFSAGYVSETQVSGVWVATSSSTYITFSPSSSSLGATMFADNISVKEIDPLAVSIQMEGRMTYADTDVDPEIAFFYWSIDGSNFIRTVIQTNAGFTGAARFEQRASSVNDFVRSDSYSPGILVPFNIASRHGSTFINGAVDGTALTEDTTPVALPDLESTDLDLGYDFMGTIKTFRMWAADLGDTGIAEASSS